MSDFPSRDKLSIGMLVNIEENSGQKKQKSQGRIKRILTKSQGHPYGIKVELEDGKTGRVISILEYSRNISSTRQEVPSEEDAHTEFKATFCLDLNRYRKGDGKKVRNSDVEKDISVTISSMANAEGGILYIGILDNGEILGLEYDYELLNNPNNDKFQRIVWQSIQNYIRNMAFISKIKLEIIEFDSRKICKIEIPQSDEPLFLHQDNIQESYVRIGPKSEKFNPSEFLKYCNKTFPR